MSSADLGSGPAIELINVRVMGAPVTGIDPRIGFVFQADALFPWRNVLDNVAAGPLYRGEARASAYVKARDWIALYVLTARPATIKSVHVIDIPRPRVISDIRYEQKFIDLSKKIWNDLKQEEPEMTLVAKDGSIVYAPGTSNAEIEAAARSAARSRKIQVIFWRLIVLFVLMGSWEISARRGWIDPFFYSYPSEILARLWELILEGTDEGPLWKHLWVTLEESLLGFFFGSLIGILCGVALGRNKMLADVFSVYIKVLNAIPRVVLAPIFILIWGFGLASKVAVSFVMVFFVVFANAFQGVREADRAMIANAQILGASNWQVTRTVIIPSAMSWIFASLHLSFSFAVVGAIVGEFIGARMGIGYLIQIARGLHDVPLMYASIIVVLLVVLAAEFVMTQVEHRLAKWRPTPASDGHV
eukprot:gene14292-14415_t